MQKQELYAYLAGIFDGEGCIHHNPNGRYYLLVEMQDQGICDLFREHFGGSLRRQKRNRPQVACYRWTGTGRAAYKTAIAILPYLRNKAQPMQDALDDNFGNKRVWACSVK